MVQVGALELLHDAPCGKVYTFLEYRRSLEQAGFVGVTEVDESLIKAVRPECGARPPPGPTQGIT
jgi:hypothetical protein